MEMSKETVVKKNFTNFNVCNPPRSNPNNANQTISNQTGALHIFGAIMLFGMILLIYIIIFNLQRIDQLEKQVTGIDKKVSDLDTEIKILRLR